MSSRRRPPSQRRGELKAVTPAAPPETDEQRLERLRVRAASPAANVIDAISHVATGTLALEVARATGTDVFDALDAVLAVSRDTEPMSAVAMLAWYERALEKLA